MIAITGASGKIGSKTVQHLIGSGKKLRLIARRSEPLKSFAEQGAEILTGSLTDPEFLKKAFAGATTVLSIIPGEFGIQDVLKHQDLVGENTINALKENGVKKLVFISSVGGHTEEKTGIVAGLARQEKRLQQIHGMDIMVLRPTYFMENLYANLQMIKSMGFNGGGLRPDKEFPMIHTSDIANVVSDILIKDDFSGYTLRPLLGPKNYTMIDVTKALGDAIGIPDLNYVHFSYSDLKNGLLQMGASESIADAYVGLTEGINEGVFDYETRDSLSTTPTTIEEFAKEFAYAYQAMS